MVGLLFRPFDDTSAIYSGDMIDDDNKDDDDDDSADDERQITKHKTAGQMGRTLN